MAKVRNPPSLEESSTWREGSFPGRRGRGNLILILILTLALSLQGRGQ